MVRCSLCLACLFIAVSSGAQEPAGKRGYRFEVTPFAGYRVGGTFEDETSGTRLELNDGGSFGLILNMRADANTEYELMFSHQDTEIDLGGTPGGQAIDIDVDYLQVGGTYLGDGRMARPYMVATIGLAHLDPGSAGLPSDTFFAFSIGGGWKLRPRERIGLRLEGRFYGTVVDSDSKIFCTSGPSGLSCLINTKAQMLWQWEMLAGLTFRF